MRPRWRTLFKHALIALLVLSTVACGSENKDPLTQALEAHAEGDLADAERLYKQVIADDPSNKFAHYNLGLIAQTEGRNDEAAASYREVLKVDPRFVPANFNLAIILTETDPDEAIRLYRRIIDIEPQNAPAHLNLGFVLKEHGDEKAGEAEIAKAIEIDPSLSKRVEPNSTAGPATPTP